MNRLIILGATALLLGLVGAATQAEQAPPVAAGFEPRPLSDFQQMLDRPLFSSNRRPLEEPEGIDEDSLDEQQLRELWRLSGIILEPQRRVALFSHRKESLHLQLEVGMTLANDWELVALAADHVELQRDERRILMLLHDPSALPIKPPPPPPQAKPATPAQPPATPAEQEGQRAPATNGTEQPAAPPKRG
ncbi:hypothetical protein [Pseudomonas sp.]|uniref:hypothetical protein n=1 Tax=Pseudomonas sp. TaxID=306 RepID=UPI003562BD88